MPTTQRLERRQASAARCLRVLHQASHRPEEETGAVMDAPRSWRDETRRCFYCRREFRPVREAQRFCKPACKRAAAYGRERFKNGTKGPRRRRLEGCEIVQTERSLFR